jgi:hypothetical protein
MRPKKTEIEAFTDLAPVSCSTWKRPPSVITELGWREGILRMETCILQKMCDDWVQGVELWVVAPGAKQPHQGSRFDFFGMKWMKDERCGTKKTCNHRSTAKGKSGVQRQPRRLDGECPFTICFTTCLKGNRAPKKEILTPARPTKGPGNQIRHVSIRRPPRYRRVSSLLHDMLVH